MPRKKTSKRKNLKQVNTDILCPFFPRCIRSFKRAEEMTKHVNNHHKGQTLQRLTDLLNPDDHDPDFGMQSQRKPLRAKVTKALREPSSSANKPKPKVKKSKKKGGGQRKDMPHQSHSRSWKMKRVIEYQSQPEGKKCAWLKKRNIPSSNMERWAKDMPKWEKLTQKDLRKSFTNSRKNKGLFHEMEELLHVKFLERRSQGWRVSYAWLQVQMKLLCEKHQPEHYDPTIYKFRNSWVRRFCRRWNISLRKKGNKKCSSVYERLHQIKNYDHFVIYQMQDPSNWDDKYFDYDVFVKKKVFTTDQDADPEEVHFEEEQESVESSDSGF